MEIFTGPTYLDLYTPHSFTSETSIEHLLLVHCWARCHILFILST